MLIVLFVLFVLKTVVSKMCMHPTIDKNLSKLYSKYENVVLDEFDNCDYIKYWMQIAMTWLLCN